MGCTVRPWGRLTRLVAPFAARPPDYKGLDSVLLSQRHAALRLGRMTLIAVLCVAALVLIAPPARAVAPKPHGGSNSASHRHACLSAARHRVRRVAAKSCAKKGLLIEPAALRHRIGPRRPAPTPPGSTGESKPTPVGESKGSAELPTTIEPVPPVEAPRVEEPPVEKKPVEEPAKESHAEEPPLEEAAAPAPFRFFAPTSFWNERLSASASVDPNSAAIVSALSALETSEQTSKKGPAINTTSWSVPIYTVPASQATVRVTLVNATSAALQSAWSAVPLPSNAQPAAGTDEHLVVWQPSTNRMWEFW